MIATIPIILIVLAAFFKAVADTLTHHFDTSVFNWWDRRFWDASVSWRYAHYLKWTKYRLDGWHLANSGMIICFCLAVVLHTSVLSWYWEVLIAGSVFNLSFNLFYNRILRRK
jgi:hypothetical protein